MAIANEIKLIYFAFKIYVNSRLWSLPSPKDESDMQVQKGFGT